MLTQLAALDGTVLLLFAFVLAGACTVTRWTLRIFVSGAWTGPRGLFRLGALYALLCALVVLGAWSLMDQITGVLVVVGAGSLMRGIFGVLWVLLRSRGLRTHQPRILRAYPVNAHGQPGFLPQEVEHSTRV